MSRKRASVQRRGPVQVLCAVAVLLVAALLLAACELLPVSTPVPSFTMEAPTSTVVVPTSASEAPTAPVGAEREIIIVHTNDEHGWLLPKESADSYQGGAAYATARWVRDGHDPRVEGSNVLLLSGGDNSTGPAISTWFQGESTIEVMNGMGYRASAVGNHEFDFGQDILRERAAQASFPYLAANLFHEGTTDLVEMVRPYLLLTVNDTKIGVVGLALRGTPQVTAAKNVEGLAFGDYEAALVRWVPVARDEGAQIIIVEAHICPRDLLVLAGKVADLKVDLFLGGHCHQSRATSSQGALVASSSSDWEDYVWTRLVYDASAGRIVESEQKVVDVISMKSAVSKPDPQTQALVEKWEERTRWALGEVIGYTATGLGQQSEAMHSLLVDSWLWAYEGADVAVSNTGGFRTSIEAGEIALSDIVGVLPFDNEIYELEVSGKDIAHALASAGSDLVFGGISHDADGKIRLDPSGVPLDPVSTYRLLVTDYLYHNTKYPFRLYDNEPYETSIHWRQPVIDWIKAQRSSEDSPIEGRLNLEPAS